MRRTPREQTAVELKFDNGSISYVVLDQFNDRFLIPMRGERTSSIETTDTIRACWDDWVGEQFDDDELLTRDQLDAEYPSIEINYED